MSICRVLLHFFCRSIVDADLETITTPPSPTLNVIDVSNNRLKAFPTYLFSPTQPTIAYVGRRRILGMANQWHRQLNIYGNPWHPSVSVDASECNRMQVAVDSGHITGLPLDCSCSSSAPTCAFPSLTSTAAPSTSTGAPVAVVTRPATSSPSPPPASARISTPSPPATVTPTTTNLLLSKLTPSTTGTISTQPPPASFATLQITASPITNNSAITDQKTAVASADDSSMTGTILLVCMMVLVLGLAAVALILYRRRQRIVANPNVLSGFEMVAMSSRNAPFNNGAAAPSKAQLLRKTSSSAVLTSSTLLPLSKQPSRDMPSVPTISPDHVKLLHSISGTRFSGKFQGEKVVLKRWDAPNQAAVASLVADIQAMAQLEHPQLLIVFGLVRFGEFDVSAVAEFMHCGSLPRVLLKHDVALSWPDQLSMCYQVAAALAYMHSQPNYSRGTNCLTSRDILVNSTLQCKLDVLDFVQATPAITPPEFSYGGASLAWEAPEVLTHNCARSSSAEMYSLGVILGEIVTRARPYQSWIQSVGTTVSDIRIRDPTTMTWPHENHPELESSPRYFKALVAACLSRDVLRRPLAVNVAETLQREMALLKRNYG
ncbi:hypothetical protein DYB25_004822 [Aphanomyces astaci]|uniref:Protein kinase domain-containing protein n=1 Tax=Aphanomyces astaci TaxID=112090 RepID=A0A397AXX0_APHAT|nr:hypothetical protein DYB25_004822 [Aphanomyces astaci]RHY36794.1 hypothetical protein DYB34_006693 [Aphanomyces astaci]RHY57118.1 hypothetical protein DYB38_002460 [Aphanomyces astaci]RHY59529.1 hypothetical protein DYB30_007759 [Aphanomyces astaci]RHZ01449.1 hypothetical protein DYB26_005969 [Aphanomyces astaci]